MSLVERMRDRARRPRRGAAARGSPGAGASMRRGIGVAAAAVLVSTALVAQSGVTSDAAWNDAEWAHGPAVGTADCAAPESVFANRGEGRALSGAILGLDLDALVEAGGVEVTNNGLRSREGSGAATPLGDDAYANPLNVVALSAVDADLGQGLLQLPLDNSTGVLGQYGRAANGGAGAGASGYVTDTGGIATAPGDAYPELATLGLSQLLAAVNPPVAGLLSNVSDVSLGIGAVAGRATLDGCAAAWSSSLAEALTREYLAASADVRVSSPTVGALVTGVNGIASSISTSASALTGTSSPLAPLVRTAISSILNPLLGALSAGSVGLSELTVTVPNPSPLLALTQGTIGDSGGIATIDLANGTITVDTARLVQAAYAATDGVTLNGLAPNTDLLGDPRVVTALTNALDSALGEWIAAVTSAVEATISGITVKAKASVRLSLIVPLADISIDIDGDLDALAAGSAVQATATVLGSINLSLLNSILTALNTGLGPKVATAARGLLPAVPALVAALDAPVASLVGAVSNVYTALFISRVVSLTVNAQNDPLAGAPEPPDWTDLTEGRYDVAALRIGVLGALPENGVRLYLGRGSVGPVCSAAGLAAGGCAGY
ncbi:choice-of-anchor G family protein [Leucobacter sp.]